MKQTTIHNPDRFMIDLRQILSQGRKRIGLLVGAGAPTSIKVNAKGELDDAGVPLIPDVETLTKSVVDGLGKDDKIVIDKLLPELAGKPNIEAILTRVRRLSQAIGSAQVHGLDGHGYDAMAVRICKSIGTIVAPRLPAGKSAFTELVSWIGGTQRAYPVEIFTPNYDLLIEEAFERAKLPYFDGFSGSHRPFFDATSVAEDALPVRWSRLWKLHGSLGWEISGDTVIRTGSRDATELIYPDHLKYDQITRQPYSAFFERLREFLTTPDSILLCSGCSFFDAHITAVLDEALAANTHTAVFAFQYKSLGHEAFAVDLACRRSNLSVYAKDGAVIFGVQGKWQPGQPPTDEWQHIRSTFWRPSGPDGSGEFVLGDFAKLARFFALAQAVQLEASSTKSESGADIPVGAPASHATASLGAVNAKP